MILSIAWRNVWRSRSRSLIVIGAVTVGTLAVVFMIGFMNSYLDGFSANAIRYDYSHIQLHHPQYPDHQETKYRIPNAEATVSELSSRPGVAGASGRLLVNAMLSANKGMQGVTIAGINPQAEAATTDLGNKLKAGTYFTGPEPNQVLVSKYVADKLELDIGHQLTCQFQDASGAPVDHAFTIVGIFSTASPRYNQGYVFVPLTDLQRLIHTPGQVHEIAVYLDDAAVMDPLSQQLNTDYPNLKAQTWVERAPQLAQIEQQSFIGLVVLVAIVMLALIFGIINTMLMAILERIKELGMLMAVGMGKAKVFAMVMVETIILSLVGAPLGILGGIALITYLGQAGIDLSAQGDSLEKMGFDPVFYPMLHVGDITLIAISVAITAVIASIFPARRATKLKPVDALRHV